MMVAILRRTARGAMLAGLCLAAAACSNSVDSTLPAEMNVPLGFPRLPVPADNALTPQRIALGKRLFFDKQLSRTREVACGSCHLQEHAFADPNRVSIGIEGRTGTRNAPSLANMAYNTSFFWDGGVPTLEQQAIQPIINPLEMNMTMSEVVGRIELDPSYVGMFQRAYAGAPKPEFVTKAIASFVRTLTSGNSRYDRYEHGDSMALTAQELRGRELFFGEKAECFHCHIGFNFTNNTFRNNGLYAQFADKGRELITEEPRDEGRFKVPTLRNIAVTAPYMHDGSLPTLDAVLDHYTSGGKGHPNTDPLIRPFTLTQQERADLIAFLTSLTDDVFLKRAEYKP